MDAITDISIKKVVVMSAAQVGKTDAMVLNPIGYYIHYEPSPIMVIQPTIQMAESFSKERLSPMIRDTPVLAERINDKSRNTEGNGLGLSIARSLTQLQDGDLSISIDGDLFKVTLSFPAMK